MVAYENEIRGGTCNKTHCSSTAEEKKNTKLKMCAVRNDTETEQLRHIGLSTNTNTSIMFFFLLVLPVEEKCHRKTFIIN